MGCPNCGTLLLLPGGVRTYAPWLGLVREPVVCARCKAEILLVTKAPILPLLFLLLLLICFSIGAGKIISSDYHANWVAASIWAFGALFAIGASGIYKEAAQGYFDGPSGTLKPQYTKRSRVRFLRVVAVASIVFAMAGILVQVFSQARGVAANYSSGRTAVTVCAISVRGSRRLTQALGRRSPRAEDNQLPRVRQEQSVLQWRGLCRWRLRA